MRWKELLGWSGAFLVAGGILLLVQWNRVGAPTTDETNDANGSPSAENAAEKIIPNTVGEHRKEAGEGGGVSEEGFVPPLDRADERVTKKPFGIYIDPVTSPVRPERFRGYHTGTDFEVFSEEEEKEVWVRAICGGTVLVKRSASGYGGVVVERCETRDGPVSVVYGHLALESVVKESGDRLHQGETIGRLGRGGSKETDGERMHLHLGIHRGGGTDLRGYVEMSSQLDRWLDPCEVVCGGIE